MPRFARPDARSRDAADAKAVQELVKEVAGTIRVPKCYGVFSDASDPGCREFCLVMESFEPSEWRTYDQFREPMTVEDLDGYLDFLAQLHGCTWDIPVNEEQKGLGEYMANWHPLAETIVGKPEVWEAVRTDWKEVFGRGMLEGFADPAVPGVCAASGGASEQDIAHETISDEKSATYPGKPS